MRIDPTLSIAVRQAEYLNIRPLKRPRHDICNQLKYFMYNLGKTVRLKRRICMQKTKPSPEYLENK